MNKPIVSVIVLNWNGEKYLPNCFESLKKQNYQSLEFILADNGSTDNSVAYTNSNFPWVKIFQYRENLGYTGANNSAAKSARGKYLFFLNNDTKVHPECLSKLVHCAETNSQTGIIAPRQLNYAGNNEISRGSGCDFLGYPCGSKLFYADGAALFIRKELFTKLNGFDRKHFIFCEDLDLSWRARLLGYDIGCQPEAIVYHKSGGTFVGGKIERPYTTNVWRRYLGERNNIRNLLKNYSLLTLIWVLPICLLLNLAEITLFLITGKIRVVTGVYLSAWLYNIKIFANTWKQHRKIQRTRKVSDWEILKRMEWKIGKLEVFKRVGIPKFQ